MITFPQNTALLLIDVQKGFDDPGWGMRNNPDAEQNIGRLLAGWRQAGQPVYHVQHDSVLPTSTLRPNQPGNDFKAIAQPLPNEPLFHKTVNSAFIGTDLEARLRQNNISALVIVGLTTDHCVSTTTRMAGNLGFQTFVVSDATATFERVGHDGNHYSAEQMHTLALVSLHNEFATIITTEQALVPLTLLSGEYDRSN